MTDVLHGSSSGYRLQVLGTFAFRCDDTPVELPQATRRLLAWLALHPTPQTRSTVAGRLWPDQRQERATSTLRTALWAMRRTAPDVIGADANRVGLDRPMQVDLWRVGSSARAMALVGAVSPQATAENVAPGPETVAIGDHLGPGLAADLAEDLLPDWPDDWLIMHRERHRQLRVHALEGLCRSLIRAGRTAEAIDVGIRVVAADPLRESGQRVLIEAHLADGNPSEAVRNYRDFVRLLHRDLGVVPSPDLTSLIPSLRVGGRRAPEMSGR